MLEPEVTVLVVDDDAAGRAVLRLACESAGYGVLEASTGMEALRTVAENAVDLVLLDVSMPNLSGLEVCRRLRAGHMATPVIMVTAHVRGADRRSALDSGADDYVRKPYVVRDLLVRVAAHLGGAEVKAARADAVRGRATSGRDRPPAS